MYEADGISLKRSEYLELVHVKAYGKQGRRTFTPSQGVAECVSLCDKGLIDFRYDGKGGIDEAWITDAGEKWLASYRLDAKMASRMRLESALISGAVSLAVALAAHFLTHL